MLHLARGGLLRLETVCVCVHGGMFPVRRCLVKKPMHARLYTCQAGRRHSTRAQVTPDRFVCLCLQPMALVKETHGVAPGILTYSPSTP